jgi:flagellar hook-basal body complex protein FliE
MSNINVQQVLSQMRVMEAQAKSSVGVDALPINSLSNTQKVDFSEVLANTVNSVNETMKASGKMAEAFEKGDSNISMAELMITMEKSSVSFQSMVQVRNKLLNAYQEIMNMPV